MGYANFQRIEHEYRKVLKKARSDSGNFCDKRNMPSLKSDLVQFVAKLAENKGEAYAIRLMRK